MREMPGFGLDSGVRQLSRAGRSGGSGGLASVPGIRCGAKPGRSFARAGSGSGIGTLSPFVVTVRIVAGRDDPARGSSVPRTAARSMQAPPRRRHKVRRPAARHWGAAKRPCRRAADNGVGAPFRGAGKAAASSRCALPSRRASVVSTASASERVETTPLGAGRRNRRLFITGGLWTFDWLRGPLWARNARKRRLRAAEPQLFSLIPSLPGNLTGLREFPRFSGCRVRTGYPRRAPRGLSWSAL